MMGRDVLNAGLGYHRRGAVVPDNFNNLQIGVPADVDGTRDMLTSVVVGNNLYQNSLATAATRTDSIAFAYRDMEFNAGNVIDLASVGAGSSAAVPRLRSKTSTGAAAAKQYDLFLVESDTSQVLVMATTVNGSNTLDAAPGDPLGVNQALNGSGQNGSVLRQCTSSSDTNCTTYSATAKRVFLVSYRVKQDGTLVRIIYGNNRGAAASAQIQELPLAYNIEDLQIKYILEDGTSSDNPSVGPDGNVGTADDDWQRFNLVRQVQITIKVQSTENDEKTKKPESITFTSTFSTRNLEYDAG